jgi:glycerol-3-phosphate O-acyltransferase
MASHLFVQVRMYNQGIHIKESEFLEVHSHSRYIFMLFLQVRKVALEAEKKKQSLIFLPCHKSHVDYLVISYIFYRLGIALPHIAAGDNLNLPIVGWLLKHGGAFFIRRSFGNDHLYQEIVREYLELLLVTTLLVSLSFLGARP